MSERLSAFYRLRGTRDEARATAEDICIEQTAESHSSLVVEERFHERVLGRVEVMEEIAEHAHEAEISYPVEVTAFQLPQLMHVLYGNVSLKRNIRLERVTFPPSFIDVFDGPRHGIAGIRELLEVRDRPLLAAALKPVGLSPEELGERALAFARGGIDILKDDHGLSDQDFCPFRERIEAVTRALEQARRQTGRRTLYFASMTDRCDRLLERTEWALLNGAAGILVSPLVTGLDTLRHLATMKGAPVIMAHPALAGAYFASPDHGISMQLILGKLMRLAGADLVIFPSHSGRFPVTREDALSVASALRARLYKLRPSWPMPAGGIDLEKVPALRADYGDDTVLLIGSSLYTRSPDLASNAARFLDLVRG